MATTPRSDAPMTETERFMSAVESYVASGGRLIMRHVPDWQDPLPMVGEMIPGGVRLQADTPDGSKTYPCRLLGPATQEEYLAQFASDPEIQAKVAFKIRCSAAIGDTQIFVFVEVLD